MSILLERKKIIVVAYDANPNIGSECRVAYLWLQILAKHFRVEAYVCAMHERDLNGTAHENLAYHFISVPKFLRNFARRSGLYNVPAAYFMSSVRNILCKSELREFSIIHCLTPEGLYSFNDFFKLGLPVIAGPVGGAMKSPRGFESVFKEQRLKNFLRDFFYDMTMRLPGWRKYFLHATKIITVTQYVVDLLPNVVKKKCSVVYDVGIDTRLFTPRNNNGKHIGPVIILYAARLESQKGITILLEAIRRNVEQGFCNFKVLICGDGPLKKQMLDFITKNNLAPFVEYQGRIAPNQMTSKYQEADIYCSPTLREPSGGAILEAMSCGLPIITTNYGGPKYSVPDNCGIKVDVNNYSQYVSDLTSALRKMVEVDDLRLLMGTNARKHVENEFSLSALERKILNVYQEALNGQC